MPPIAPARQRHPLHCLTTAAAHTHHTPQVMQVVKGLVRDGTTICCTIHGVSRRRRPS
jgi:hypothetical protein